VAATALPRETLNQPPPLEDWNPFDADLALQEALEREGRAFGADGARAFGARVGSAEAIEHSRRAERNRPRLMTHDRYGHRADHVDYDPSWHWMLRLGVESQVHSLAWNEPRPGAHVARAALFYLMNALDTAPCCPIGVNYAAVPTLRQEPQLAAAWEEAVRSADYDAYAQGGMAMTEKQGGSDLRANTTRADPQDDGTYLITGHKWFCSIVMCDFFFTAAQAPGGLTCFLMLRDEGFRVQRLKDKLGGRALASSEVEFRGCRAFRIGHEGEGIPMLGTQVNYTRFDTALGMAGIMRRALSEAVHHCRHRSAFGRLLADQPLMRNVLADLAIEQEAALAACMRLASTYDHDSELALRRMGTAVIKYWVCKRAASWAVEALECLGGNGYVEESVMPRLYRDIEIGTVWEGSGNVAALDVLRAMRREPEMLEAFVAECERARGADAQLDAHLDALRESLRSTTTDDPEWHGRRLVEDMALAFEGSLLVRHAPPAVADAFCAARLGEPSGRVFGTLPAGVAADEIVNRALAI
jgi:putative acyl-CoA dehydrogenase